jgi:hypothetical protein
MDTGDIYTYSDVSDSANLCAKHNSIDIGLQADKQEPYHDCKKL